MTTSGRQTYSDPDFPVNLGIALYPTSATDAGGLLQSAAAATLAARDKGVDAFHFG